MRPNHRNFRGDREMRPQNFNSNRRYASTGYNQYRDADRDVGYDGDYFSHVDNEHSNNRSYEDNARSYNENYGSTTYAGSNVGPNEREYGQWRSSSRGDYSNSDMSYDRPSRSQNQGSGQGEHGDYRADNATAQRAAYQTGNQFRGDRWDQQNEYGHRFRQYGQMGRGGSQFTGRGSDSEQWGNPSSQRYGGQWGHSSYGESQESDPGKMKNYSGLGPKGYKRSDDRIREDVSEALYHAPHIDASNIEVDVKDGIVTLTGNVESRSIKRQAEDCIEHVSGVKDVTNNLRVDANASSSSTASSVNSGNGSDKSAGSGKARSSH